MGSTTDDALGGEKPTSSQVAINPDKAGAVNSEKGRAGESIPGWTIMRPLRRNVAKATGSEATTKVDATANGKSIDDKAENDLKITDTNISGQTGEVELLQEVRSDDELLAHDGELGRDRRDGEDGSHNMDDINGLGERPLNNGGEYKVYKRRWFGLAQLVLLNIMVSWDVSASFLYASAPVACSGMLTNHAYSGSRSQPALRQSPNTTVFPKPRSIGLVPRSSLHSWLCHPSSSTPFIAADLSHLS
jgi:hypothetical protein